MKTASRLLPALLFITGCDGGSGDSGAATAGSTGDTGAAACYADRQAMKPPVSMSIQETWGAACQTNADCEALLGDGAICDFAAVVYELPGGYCTKPCVIGPDPQNTNMTVELDDDECDPNGGVHCVGANTIYARCAVPCTDDSQCGREGYFCRTMPQIGADGDPTVCLMDDCCDNMSCAP